MKKFAKIALIVIGAVIVLITAAALLVPHLVDPNQYKSRISAVVKEKTGRDLTIAGDISLSVFPWLGAEIGDVELGSGPGFETATFAAVRKVKVKVKLLPLLSKNVEADVITVEGLVLNLERGPEGHTNWEDLSKTSAGAAPEEPEPAPSETSSMEAIAVGGLDIRDARISWTDRQTDTNVTINNLAVKTSAINMADPVEMNVRFDLDAGGLGLTGTVDTNTHIEFDLDAGRYAATGLSLTANLGGDAVPGGKALVTLGGDAAFDAGAQTFNLGGIRLEATGLNLAPYTVDTLVEADGTGDLAAGIIRLGNLEATVTLTGEEDRLTAAVTASADADLNTQQFNLTDLALRIPELSMKGLQAAIETKKTGAITADLAAGTVVLDAPAITGSLSGEAVPGGGAPVALDLHVRGDLNRKTFTAAPVTLSVADMTATADIDLAQPESGLQVSGNLAVARFNLRDLLTRLGVSLPDTADAQALSAAEISMKLNANTRSATIDNLSLRLDDSTLSGALAVNNFEAPETTLDLSLDRLQLERYLPPDGSGTPRLLTNVTLKGKISADAGFKVFQVADFSLAGKLDKKLAFGLTASDTHADLDKETISVKALSLSAGKMALKASAEVADFSSSPVFTASVQSETFNLRQVLSDAGSLPDTADTKALSAVKLSASLGGTPDAVSVSSLKLRLDNTNITGKADMTLAPATAYTFDIAIDSIDADRYLPPPAPESATQKKTGQATAAPAAAPTPLPTELLQGLALEGKLSVGKLKINKLNLADIQLKAAANEGLLTLDPLSADLYEGACSGNIRLDARGQVPNLSLAVNLAGVQSGKLLKDLQGEAVITGLANAEMSLSATGPDTDTLLSSLGGTVSFTFTDGRIEKVDIAGKICNTVMAVRAGSLKTEDLVGSALQFLTQKATGTQTETTEADSTSFSEMGGSMTFSKGVGTSDDLSMKSPMLRVQGSGSLDLTKQYLDYGATAYLVKSCQGQGGESSDDLRNVPIPVTIKGPLTKLKVKPDLTTGILEILARKQSKKSEKTSTTQSEQKTTADEVQEKPQTVEDAVTGILKDLLK